MATRADPTKLARREWPAAPAAAQPLAVPSRRRADGAAFAFDLTQVPPSTASGGVLIQRKCACGGGGCSSCGDEEESALRPTTARAPAQIQRAAVEGSAEISPASPAGGLIAEDDAAALTHGQMRKTAVLDQIRAQGCAAADRELARAGRDTRGCPHVERWAAYYAARPAGHLERAIRKLVPAAAGARAASDYLPLVSARMAAGVRAWVDTGQLPTDLPEELRAQALGGAAGAIGGAVASALGSAAGVVGRTIGGLFFKDAAGGAHGGVDRAALTAQLGAGRPLDGAGRQRMETAFGQDFGHVRIHDDAGAGALSRDLNAHAFTLGNHVAFQSGAYRPGTPAGDALLAHELAHVVQQQGAAAPAGAVAVGSPHDALEDEADRAAEGAVTALWSAGATPSLGRRRAAPTGRAGGLRLQRCGGAQQQAAGRATTPAQGVPRAAPRGRNPVDATGEAIIALAQDQTVPLPQRGPQLLERIVQTYYPADVGLVRSYIWVPDIDGLFTDCPGGARRDASVRCTIEVGEYFVTHTDRANLAHRVLQTGHELEHIRQHREGLGGATNRHEREFLAFYHEALATEFQGTGREQHATRVDVIDEAIRHFNCFDAATRERYETSHRELLTLRETQQRRGGNDATPVPTDCAR